MTGVRDSGCRPHRIVIAGDGLEAWMAAAALVESVRGEDFHITVVPTERSEEPAPGSLADATLPWPDPEPVALHLDEDGAVARTAGAFSFGVAMSGWSAPDATWFLPFSSIGAPLGPVSFIHLAMRLRHEGVPVRMANYALAALAAQAGRFERPGKNPRSVLSTCRYGVHLDAREWAECLKARALTDGVDRATAPLQRVEADRNGSIDTLATADGGCIEGDLFLDCSGARALLCAGRDGKDWQDWSSWLPCNRIVQAESPTTQAPTPFSHAQADPGGWTRYLPLQGRTVIDRLFSDQVLGEDQAVAPFGGQETGEGLREVRTGPVRFGRRKEAWRGNCVALGTAAAMIDPVAMGNTQLLRSGLNRLLQLLPVDADQTVEAAEYNRQTRAELDNARDFTVLHYRLNNRRGEALWDACRAMRLPDSLDYKIRLYKSRGRVSMYDFEPWDEESWAILFDEHGVYPRRYHAMADGFDTRQIRDHAQRVREVMISAVRNMPAHGDYLARLLDEPIHEEHK